VVCTRIADPRSEAHGRSAGGREAACASEGGQAIVAGAVNRSGRGVSAKGAG
jgi:hypothetical protein